MQLTIKIIDGSIADKIVWFLDSFKDKGVEIVFDSQDNVEKQELTDEYIEKHWKEILMNTKSDPDYYGSEQYKLDRGQYLMEKYK